MGLSDQIRQYLSCISLHDVLQRKNVRQVADRQDRQASAPPPVEMPMQRDISMPLSP
jgi:Rrf2 family iron-sulfur cluster assembly transcriptional regulator